MACLTFHHLRISLDSRGDGNWPFSASFFHGAMVLCIQMCSPTPPPKWLCFLNPDMKSMRTIKKYPRARRSSCLISSKSCQEERPPALTTPLPLGWLEKMGPQAKGGQLRKRRWG